MLCVQTTYISVHLTRADKILPSSILFAVLASFFFENVGGASCPTFSLIEETWHRAKLEVYRGEHMVVQTGQAASKKEKNGYAIRALKT